MIFSFPDKQVVLIFQTKTFAAQVNKLVFASRMVIARRLHGIKWQSFQQSEIKKMASSGKI
jgi:hypothetical protein